jgi:hypothetical protein
MKHTSLSLVGNMSFSQEEVAYKQRIGQLFQGKEYVTPDEAVKIYAEWGDDYEKVNENISQYLTL